MFRPEDTATFNFNVVKEHIDIVPEIKLNLEYPLIFKDGAVQKQIDNPEITIVNVGPVKVVALSVDFKTYYYDKNLGVIGHYSEFSKKPHDHLIFERELRPTDSIKQQLNGFHGKDLIGIYVFSVKYYREDDFQVFIREERFFLEKYEISSEENYSKNIEYSKVLQAIKNFSPKTENQMCFQAVDSHIWFMKDTPKTGMILLGEDGKNLILSQIPDEPRKLIEQTYLHKKRPLLYVLPVQWKESETYFKPELIDENTVKVILKYKVENIGDASGTSISEVGGQPYNKILKPGEIAYLAKPIFMRRPSEVPVSAMDVQDFSIEAESSIMYFQESVNTEYITKHVYRIQKSDISLIKYLMK